MDPHAVHSLTREGRNQTRVNIDDTIDKVLRNDESLQKSAKNNIANLCLANHAKKCFRIRRVRCVISAIGDVQWNFPIGRKAIS